jgi:hypothetical protein
MDEQTIQKAVEIVKSGVLDYLIDEEYAALFCEIDRLLDDKEIALAERARSVGNETFSILNDSEAIGGTRCGQYAMAGILVGAQLARMAPSVAVACCL